MNYYSVKLQAKLDKTWVAELVEVEAETYEQASDRARGHLHRAKYPAHSPSIWQVTCTKKITFPRIAVYEVKP